MSINKERERERKREGERAWNSSYSKRTIGKVCDELGQRVRSYIVWWFLAMAELPVSKKYILISSLHQQLPGQTAAADLGLHHFSGSPVLLLLLLLLQAFIRLLCNLVQYSEFISATTPTKYTFLYTGYCRSFSFSWIIMRVGILNLMWWSMQLCSPHFHDQCRRSSISYSKPKDHPDLSTVPISQLLM